MYSIGVTLVSGRRADLLEKTLASFQENLLCNVTVSKVRVNVDPIFGGVDDERATLRVVDQYFPGAEVRQPETPSFGAAVKCLWSGVDDGIFLHLEDDWLLLEPIDPATILGVVGSKIRAATMLSATHGRAGRREFNEARTKRFRLLGGILGRRVPRFGTCPGFFDGEFARTCATLMDPALDPEKQMRRPHNSKLNDYIEDYRCVFLKSRQGSPIIHDIGREWREQRKIDKVVLSGKSHWVAR